MKDKRLTEPTIIYGGPPVPNGVYFVDDVQKPFPKEEAYGLRFSFKFWKWGIEIWQKGWLEK